MIDSVGITTHRTAITVTSTAQAITVTVGKRTIEIQNLGTKNIYYGGSGVTSLNGIRVFPSQTKVFANVKDTFSIYLVTASGDTADTRIVEYD